MAVNLVDTLDRMMFGAGFPCWRFGINFVKWMLATVVLVSFACLLTNSVYAFADEGSTRRPNIVFIMADDMGYECVGANGGESYRTPRLDQLAADGLRFEHCHSQPICTPSRVQVMTGVYNNRNYVRFGVLDSEHKTFGNVFRDAGYKTCVVGKWQLDGGLTAPAHFGFDEYCLWQLNRRPGRYSNPGLEINGRQVNYRDGEYGPDVVSDYLCDFIRRNRDTSFFAYYPMLLPHFPFVPTPDSPNYDRTLVGEKGIGQGKYFKDMVEYTDKIVGKVIDCLEEQGLRKNTLVIFTGDNGTYPRLTSVLNGKPYPGGKGSTTDNGTHVPLIASWPGTIPAGRVTQTLVDFTDMLPTMADAAGIGKPLLDWQLDGHSFLPILRNPDAEPHRSHIYCWYHRDGVREEAIELVRTQAYKLYADGRMFDTRTDLQEQHPLKVSELTGLALSAYQQLRPELDGYRQITVQADHVQNLRRSQLKREPVRRQPR